MIEAIKLFMFIYYIPHMVALIIVTDTKDGCNFFNPIRNYKVWTSMNWFGVILCTTLLHVLLPVYAVCYWFYKLCTFGRKQEKE